MPAAERDPVFCAWGPSVLVAGGGVRPFPLVSTSTSSRPHEQVGSWWQRRRRLGAPAPPWPAPQDVRAVPEVAAPTAVVAVNVDGGHRCYCESCI